MLPRHLLNRGSAGKFGENQSYVKWSYDNGETAEAKGAKKKKKLGVIDHRKLTAFHVAFADGSSSDYDYSSAVVSLFSCTSLGILFVLLQTFHIPHGSRRDVALELNFVFGVVVVGFYLGHFLMCLFFSHTPPPLPFSDCPFLRVVYWNHIVFLSTFFAH